MAKKNGDFLPTFLVDGFVAGLWSVATTKGVATLRLEPFGRSGPADRRALEAEGERLVRFIEADAADGSAGHRRGVDYWALTATG